MNSEERHYFGNLESKLAALSTEVRLHHEMVQEGMRNLQDSYKERERNSREEMTVMAQTIRTVSEWQIGHANSTYHRDLADRITEVEANLTAIAELHIERRLKESAEDRARMRTEATEQVQALRSTINTNGARIKSLEDKLHDEEVANAAKSTLVKRQSAIISFVFAGGGSIVGIVVGLNLA